MAISDKVRNDARRREAGALGPVTAFGVTVGLAFAALLFATLTLPKDFALAAVSSAFFVFAALVAIIAWRFARTDSKALSYWDVAGALTLFGICAATLMESDQVVRLIESQRDWIVEN